MLFHVILWFLAPITSNAMSVRELKKCAVVGVGVLGKSFCRQLLESPEFAGYSVLGLTKTSSHHKEIWDFVGRQYSDRFELRISAERGDEKYDNVVFCAPPSGFDDYPAAVKDAVDNLWSGPENGGVFIYTSTGAVYGPGNKNLVTESSEVADTRESPRIARAVGAEEACRARGGCVLRLAGLYDLERGPHNFWLTSGKGVSGGPDGIINMLHYDDAAGACLAALKGGPSVCNGKTYLISDGNPLTRKQICESALKNKIYGKCKMPEFRGNGESMLATGKVYDGSYSNRALNWKPRFESFDMFMSEAGVL